MHSARRRFRVALAVAALATLFQMLPGSCAQLAANTLVTVFDFCAVVNCQGSSFFNFCDPVVLLVDCPP